MFVKFCQICLKSVEDDYNSDFRFNHCSCRIKIHTLGDQTRKNKMYYFWTFTQFLQTFCAGKILLKIKNTPESCYIIPNAILDCRSKGFEQILENQGHLLLSNVRYRPTQRLHSFVGF